MGTAYFRFYEELNDFLPSARKKQEFSVSYNGTPSIKDLIESLGVPHTEVDMILVNGKSVDFRYKLTAHDRVSVYPVFESLDVSGITRLRPEPLRIPRFICDAHLGRLMKYLRLAGFDTFYNPEFDDRLIVDLSVRKKRIILTRDRGLLKNRLVTRGYWIRSAYPREQFNEVVQKFDLTESFKPFSLCVQCNEALETVNKDEIDSLLLPRTRKYYNDFKRCPACMKIFWEGSHYEKMKEFITSF